MGQYYQGCVLAPNKKTVVQWVSSYQYSNGAKLMEHSYIKNTYVSAFESLIFKNPKIVEWGGDYAENCKGRKTNLYFRCTDKNEVKPTTKLTLNETRFVVNHTKKLFVDTRKINPITASWSDGDMRIHPLPLLTCNGNGQGGGDYFGKDDNNIVGSWARNLISVEPEKPIGYKELIFDLNKE